MLGKFGNCFVPAVVVAAVPAMPGWGQLVPDWSHSIKLTAFSYGSLWKGN